MRILQTNLGRSPAAHDIAYAVARERNVDLVIIAEPNVKLAIDQGLWLDNRNNVAMLVINKHIGVSQVERGAGFVKVTFDGWQLYGCYISPNIPLSDFKDYIDSIMTQIRDGDTEAVFAGDLNAKSALWGSPFTNDRGHYVAEWVAELNLVILNTGTTPTFERGRSQSYIDVTGATANLAGKVKDWEVLSGEVLTYHHHILFNVDCQARVGRRQQGIRSIFDSKRFEELIRLKASQEQIDCLEGLSALMVSATKGATTIVREGQRERPYWWNAGIENQRRICHQLRRRVTRAHARGAGEYGHVNGLEVQYRESCKLLKRLIRQSKREHWKTLCNDLENDIWGAGYKIAMKQLSIQRQPFSPSLDQKVAIIEQLFPQTEDFWTRGEIANEVPAFTVAELLRAAERIKAGRAPGPDHIPPEAVKIAVGVIPLVFLGVFNLLLREQEFPASWKMASVSLIWKGKSADPSCPSSFRPICLLSTVGKLFEGLVRDRLEEELEQKGGLCDRQFGFRKGRSAVQAINMVVDSAKRSRSRWFVVIALDVKNAFNTATWSKIIGQMRSRGISPYLVNVVESYFSNRVIRVNKSKTIEVTAGVPQGSVLGPLLWNVLYDQVLTMPLTEGATSVAYADDLAIMVEATDERELQHRVSESIARVSGWMTKNNLTLAPQKTEAIILKGPRSRAHVYFEVLGERLVPVRQLRYLGVVLDDRMTFGEHIRQVVEKAQVKMSALTRILPNIGGPSSPKRVSLCLVVRSIVLYGAPVWYQAASVQKYRKMLLSVQRKALLRIASSYRTVSTTAIQVVTAVPPITLLIGETCRLYQRENAHLSTVRSGERETTLREWQAWWSGHSETAQWTKRLIPDLLPWVTCGHRRLDYFVTQFLTGHGNFRFYLKRMNLTQDDTCRYCGSVDTAEHTILACHRWSQWRVELENDLDTQINVESIVPAMLSSQRGWSRVCLFIRNVLLKKKLDERETELAGEDV